MIDHAGGTAGSTEGYRAAFALLAVLPLATWFWVRHTEELPPVIAAVYGPPQRSWDSLNEPAFRRLIIVNWVLSSCWDIAHLCGATIGHERGLSARSSAPSLGVSGTAAAVVRLLLPLAAKHVREHAVVAGAMVVTAVLFGVYPFLPSALAMLLCSVLLGFAWLGAAHGHEPAKNQITPSIAMAKPWACGSWPSTRPAWSCPCCSARRAPSLGWRACSGWWVPPWGRVHAPHGA